MAQPTPYTRLYNFTDYQTVNPTTPLPANQLDNELNAIALTAGQIRSNLAQIQRDDGALANESVTPDSLSAGTLAMINQGEYNPRGAWVASTAYAIGDVVTFNAATYLCLVVHTSSATFATDLASTKWLLIANGALSGGASAVDLFEGTGSQTVFTLSYTYNGSNSATVFVGGVAKIPTQDFTISGTTLTFVTAPPAPGVAGQKNIMVRGTGVEAQLAGNNATTSAANAAASATAAAGSATAAASSATAAAAAASNVNTGVTAAAASATAAAGSASTATTQATNASASATASASSATAAAGSATAAASSSTDATASALLANDWATKTSGPVAGGEFSAKYNAALAAASATTAAGSATTASTHASTASAQATAAAASATAAAASYDAFDDRYLGAKTGNPSVDNDGSALLTGALYWNTTAGEMRVWNGTTWVAATISPDTTVERSFLATAGQTSYTFTSGYRVGFTYVWVNGALLYSSEYTATDGTTITFGAALSLNDKVRILTFKAAGSVAVGDIAGLQTQLDTMNSTIAAIPNPVAMALVFGS